MKKIIPAIICSSAILTTVAFSQQIIIAKSNSSTTHTKTTANQKVVADPAITNITNQLLQPIRIQAKRANKFSRRSYVPPSTYNLVEVTSSQQQAQGSRFFNIMVTPPKTKTSAFKISKLKLQEDKVTTVGPGPQPTTAFNLKYLTASNKVLIKQDHEWVEKSKHKYLKLLPVIVNIAIANKK